MQFVSLAVQVEHLKTKSMAQKAYAHELEHSVKELRQLLERLRSRVPIDVAVDICDVLVSSPLPRSPVGSHLYRSITLRLPVTLARINN